MASSKVVTGRVRFSYVHLAEPRVRDSGKPKYEVTLLIPKSDTTTLNALKAGIAAAAEAFRQKNGAASLPQNPIDPIYDGDGVKPTSGEPYDPECKGHWVMAANAQADRRPVVVDQAGNPILNIAEVYSGCYGRASLNFYGYSNKRKGVGAGLLAIQKLADGEPLTGGAVGSADDFNDGYSAGDSDDFLA